MALCGAIVCHYVQCAMCARGRGDLWCSLSVHSLPGKTPSPCTPSQYTASNNLTFDCFEQLALRWAFFFCCNLLSVTIFQYILDNPPFQCTHYDHDIHNRIGWVPLDMLCAVVACVRINIFYVKYRKKGKQQKRSTSYIFNRLEIQNKYVLLTFLHSSFLLLSLYLGTVFVQFNSTVYSNFWPWPNLKKYLENDK